MNWIVARRISVAVAVLLGAARSWGASGAVEALCGPVPERGTAEMAQAQEAALRSMERAMPPVTDQGKSDWCFAHATACLLEYRLHQKTGQPYTTHTLFSTIDLAEEGSFYLDQNILVTRSYAASPSVSFTAPAPGTNGFNDKQDPMDILLRVQERGAGRSAAQLAWVVADEEREDRALAEVRGRSRMPPKANSSDSLSGALGTNRSSQALLLFNWEILRDWEQGDFSRPELQHYEELAAAAGPPDIAMPPFVANRYSTRDPVKAAAKIHERLQAGEPVAFFIRGADVPGGWHPYDPAESHIMVIIGAGYLGNQPVVRLRNSWSARWGESGYITSPADAFLKWLQNSASVMRGQILLTWLGDEPPGSQPAEVAGKMARIEDDFSVFTGAMKDQLQFTRGGYVHHYGYVTGTRVYSDGRTDEYLGGKGVIR
jgi:Papain family cysteine protease